MIRCPLRKIQLQELPKTQRVTHPPGDPTLRILPLEEPEQKQPEIPARHQSRTPYPLRVEARAFLLHETVESRFLQNPVQPIVERMPRRSRKLRRRYPQLLLLRLAASQGNAPYLIPSRLTRETYSTGCYQPVDKVERHSTGDDIPADRCALRYESVGIRSVPVSGLALLYPRTASPPLRSPARRKARRVRRRSSARWLPLTGAPRRPDGYGQVATARRPICSLNICRSSRRSFGVRSRPNRVRHSAKSRPSYSGGTAGD